MKLSSTVISALFFGLIGCGGEGDPAPAPPDPAPAAPKPTVTSVPCRLQALDGQARSRTCGVLRVEQARFAAPAQRPAGLAPIDVYVEHYAGSGAEPPLVYLTGGPGVSLESYTKLGVVQKILATQARGVILVEQRGNPLSQNGLTCAEGEPLASCRAALLTGGVLAEAFNSRESAADVAEVIEALGYPRAVIWGHSYGSALAQRVVQHHPERVAALILEGVSVPDRRDAFDLLQHLVKMLDGFGTWHKARCSADAACQALYPKGLDPANEGTQLASLFDMNAQLSIPLTPKLSFDGKLLEDWAVNGMATFEGMLLFSELTHAILSSSPQDRGPLDAFITRLGDGDLAIGQSFLEGFVAAIRGAAATGLSGVVKTCTDLDRVGSDPACAGLDGSVYSRESLKFTLTTSTPTLWMQGPLDTQTPIEQADSLRPQFSSLTEVLFAPCLGHFSFLDGESCSAEVVSSFLATPTAPLPSCVAQICDLKPLSLPRKSP